MTKRKAKCPISDEVWAQLDERDFISSNCTYYEFILDAINKKEILETDEVIKTLENVLEALHRVGSVSNIIDSLRDEEFVNRKNYIFFSRRFEQLFKTSGLTLNDLAQQLGVSHTSISKSYLHSDESDKRRHEKSNTQIYKHYLKAYSIIFSVSPYYLIGVTDEPTRYVLNGEKRMLKLDNETEQAERDMQITAVDAEIYKGTLGYDIIHYILNSLYQARSEHKPAASFTLPIISFFCNAKYEMRQKMKNVIMSFPHIEKVMKASIYWPLETKNFDINKDIYKNEKWLISISLENAQKALKKLYFRDFIALKLLAVITRQRPNLKESIHNLLVYGGFTADTTAYLNKWKYGMAVCDPDRGEMLPTLLKESDIIKGIPFVLST